jgi:hypothetical protein
MFYKTLITAFLLAIILPDYSYSQDIKTEITSWVNQDTVGNYTGIELDSNWTYSGWYPYPPFDKNGQKVSCQERINDKGLIQRRYMIMKKHIFISDFERKKCKLQKAKDEKKYNWKRITSFEQ